MMMKMSTSDLAPLVQPGGPLFGIEVTNGGLVPFAGGIPLRDAHGEPVGAIGVSAGTVEQDEEVAAAGAAAFHGELTRTG
jgi:uncharacterized protein GlcG (DUF336 family)